jgi:hypothetical protein
MVQLDDTTTTRGDDKYGLECGVTVYPDEERPPKVGVWVYDDSGLRKVRVAGFPLTESNLRQLYGKAESGISVSSRVYHLIADTIEESPAELPDIE